MARTLVIAFAVALLALPAFADPSVKPTGTTFTLDAPLGATYDGGVIEGAPFFTATVSNGAEPTILVDKLGRAITEGIQSLEGVQRTTTCLAVRLG